MNTESLAFLRFLYSKVSDRVTMWNFCKGLNIARTYKSMVGYELPVINIDGKVYFDPKGEETKRFGRVEDVVLMLQDTIDEVGGWN